MTKNKIVYVVVDFQRTTNVEGVFFNPKVAEKWMKEEALRRNCTNPEFLFFVRETTLFS